MNTKKTNLLLIALTLFVSLKAQPPGWWTDAAVSDYCFHENIGQVHDGTGTPSGDVLFYTGDVSFETFILDKSKVAFLTRNYGSQWTCKLSMIKVCNINQVEQQCGTVSAVNNTGEVINYYDEFSQQGVVNVQNFEGVRHDGAFTNINVLYSSNINGVATYYEVMPGGNPTDIYLRFEGQSALNVIQNSYIEATMGSTSFTFSQLEAYQFDPISGTVVSLGWKPIWTMAATDAVSLTGMGSYDPSIPLYLVDVPPPPPVPPASIISGGSDWSTRYGGGPATGTAFSDEDGGTIRVDKTTGDIYHTMSRPTDAWFPTTSGCEQGAGGGGYDIYISKFESGTYKRLWSTYFGGAGDESCRKMELAASNAAPFDNIYITGLVSGGNLPMAVGGGGTFIQSTNSGGKDGLIASFNKSVGFRQWVTHFGGAGDDEVMSLSIDEVDKRLYITGYTTTSPTSAVCNTPVSGKFPLCNASGRYFQSAYGSTPGDWQGFVAEFDIASNFNSLEWSTLFGGNEEEISFDVLKVNTPTTKALYIAGMTQSESSVGAPPVTTPLTAPAVAGDFPFANPGGGSGNYFQYKNDIANDDDGFISKFNSTYALEWSTQFGGAPSGGTSREQFTALAYNTNTGSDESVYAVGLTSTVNLGGNYCDETNQKWWPTCYGPTWTYGQSQLAGTTDALSQVGDVMIARFSPGGKLLWSTYFGGGPQERYNFTIHPKDEIVRARMDGTNNLYIYGTSTHRRTPGLSAPGSTPTRAVASGMFGTIYNQANNASNQPSENVVTYAADVFLACFNHLNIFAYGTYFGGWSDIGGAPTIHGQADEIAKDFDVDGIKAVYLTGRQASWGTPEKQPPAPGYFAHFDRVRGDWNCFITKLTVDPWWVTTGIKVAPPETGGDKAAIFIPNPMAGGTVAATVELETENPASAQLSIYDMLGKQYYTGNFALVKGSNKLPIDLSNANMATGMYTIKISGEAVNKTILLIVK